MAGNLLMSVSQNEQERAVFRSRRMYRIDMQSNWNTVFDKGEKQGIANGEKLGLEKGAKLGLAKDEDLMASLMQILLSQGQIEDAAPRRQKIWHSGSSFTFITI